MKNGVFSLFSYYIYSMSELFICRCENSLKLEAIGWVAEFMDFQQQQSMRFLSKNINKVILQVIARIIQWCRNTILLSYIKQWIIFPIYFNIVHHLPIFKVILIVISHLVVSISSRTCVHHIVRVIVNGYLQQLITLDLQCTNHQFLIH